MSSTPTLVGPTATQQINRYLYVGQGFLHTIQNAVDFAATHNDTHFLVVIPPGYGGADTIASIVRGGAQIWISDQRNGNALIYQWSGAQYVGPILALNGKLIQNSNIDPEGYTLTVAGTALAATAASGADATGWVSIGSNNGQGTTGTTGEQGGKGAPTILVGGYGGNAPAGSTNGNGGDVYVYGGYEGRGAGSPGIPGDVHIQDNDTVPVGVTLGDTYIGGGSTADATIIRRGGGLSTPNLAATTGDINNLSGNTAEFDSATIPHLIGPTLIDDLTATTAELDEGFVANSPIRTFANTPDAPDAPTYPPAGIGISTGTAWSATSIDPATVPLLDSNNDLLVTGAIEAQGDMPSLAQRMNVSNTMLRVSSGGNPVASFINAGAAADQKYTDLVGFSDGLHLRFLSDDLTEVNEWMTVTRSGFGAQTISMNTLTSIVLNAPRTIATGTVAAQGYTAPDFTKSGITIGVGSDSSSPTAVFVDNAAPADQKRTTLTAWANQFRLAFQNDAGAENLILQAVRSGSAPTALNLFPPVIMSNGLTAHGFSTPDFSSSGVYIGVASDANSPIQYFTNNGAPANQKRTTISAWGDQLRFSFEDDAGNDALFMNVTRSGNTPTAINTFAPLLVSSQSGSSGTINFPAGASITGSSGGNLALNGNGPGSILLNWSGNAANVIFGNGAGTEVAHVANNGVCVFGGLGILSRANLVNLGYAGPNINTDGQSVIINGNTGQSVFLNWDGGGAAVNVGNGAGSSVATFDSSGNFHANGNITSGGAKSFRIVHPLDDTKNLTHTAIEGPENAVFYRGEGQTDDTGAATITLPDYFEALTLPTDRTVQLTELFEDDSVELGKLAASRVKDGAFKVRSEYASQKFYWEVKAVRADIDPLEVVTDRDLHTEQVMPIPTSSMNVPNPSSSKA
jgi:hypothetical protein